MSVWRVIPQFPDYYASITGDILSLRQLEPHIMNQSPDGRGYLVVNINRGTKLVHRLVASAFLNLDLNDSKQVVLHLDDNGKNNNLSNLMLGTQADNITDMINKKRHSYGDRHSSKLRSTDVATIRARLTNGEKGRTLAKEYKVSPALVSSLKHNTRWKT